MLILIDGDVMILPSCVIEIEIFAPTVEFPSDSLQKELNSGRIRLLAWNKVVILEEPAPITYPTTAGEIAKLLSEEFV